MLRREFLSLAASTYLAPRFVFPTKPIDRLSVASYPFREFIEHGMNLVEFGKRVKKEWGIHNIEPLNTHFRSTEQDYLAGLREDLKSAGIGIANIAADLPGSLYDPDDAVRAKAIEVRKKWIDVAAKVGSPSVRLNDPPSKKSGPDAERAGDSCKKLGAYGAERGIVVNLENDNPVSEDAFFIAKVIRQVNSPYVRALPDFCNSMMPGNEKFAYDAMRALFPLAWNVCHVKEFESGEKGTVLSVDVARVFGILRESKFRGYCSMEFDSEGDPFQGTAALIQKSLKYLA